MGLSRNPLAAFVVFATAVFLVYAHTLHAPFVFDDITIRDNAFLHPKTPGELIDVLFMTLPDHWAGDASIGHRRIGYLTFATNFYFHGLDPFGYRLTNVVIHLLNGLLIYWLVAKTLMLAQWGGSFRGTPPCLRGVAGEDFTTREAHQIAFFVALIWLVHPVQIQAVTYIVQRLASLAALFSLLAFVFYLQGRLREDRWRYGFYGLSVLAGLLAMGVKQNAVVLPFLIFLYDIYFFHDSPWAGIKKQWQPLLLLGVFLLVATLIYMGPSVWARLEGPVPMEQRLLTEARVILHYLSLLVLPLPSRLVADYDFALSTSLWQPLSTLFAVGAIVALIALALRTARKCRLLSFSILWFFGCLAIESTIVPLELAFEHRLYLASIGPIGAAAVVTFRMLPVDSRWISPALLSVATVVFAAWTYERNEVWGDPVRLWTDTVQKSPGKARVHGNLGKALLDAGRYDEAAAAFETALRLDPSLGGAYNNLAVIYIDHLKQYDRAKDWLSAALQRYPNFASAYLNLGVIALNQRDLPEAIRLFSRVLELDPQNQSAHYNLAACYINLRQFREAITTLDRGISYWPAAHRLYVLKGRASLMAGDIEQARVAFEKAYALAPNEPEVRYRYDQAKAALQ